MSHQMRVTIFIQCVSENYVDTQDATCVLAEGTQYRVTSVKTAQNCLTTELCGLLVKFLYDRAPGQCVCHGPNPNMRLFFW